MGGAEADQLVTGLGQGDIGLVCPAVENVSNRRLQAEFNPDAFWPVCVWPLHLAPRPTTGVRPVSLQRKLAADGCRTLHFVPLRRVVSGCAAVAFNKSLAFEVCWANVLETRPFERLHNLFATHGKPLFRGPRKCIEGHRFGGQEPWCARVSDLLPTVQHLHPRALHLCPGVVAAPRYLARCALTLSGIVEVGFLTVFYAA